jgi:hypothetical protein
LTPEKTIIGLSSGLIAAAAASSLPVGGSCIPVAVEAVRVAFRLGVHVYEVSEYLHPAGGNTDTWSVRVSGGTEAELKAKLVNFHTRTVCLIVQFGCAYPQADRSLRASQRPTKHTSAALVLQI